MMLVRASPAWSHAHRIHETEDIMRQLTVNETRSLHWSDVPAPRLSSPQSAVVRPIAVATCGECTVSTMYAGGPTAIPLFEMFQNCVTLRTGQPHVRAHLDAVLALLAEGRLDLRALTEAVVDWEEAPRAFAHGHGKIVCVR
jgi:threonine dehydrogenase-like Zn-dependent dehydrogenase